MLEIILKILFVVFSSVAAGMIGFISYRIGNKDGLKVKEKEVKYHRETIAGLTNKLQVAERKIKSLQEEVDNNKLNPYVTKIEVSRPDVIELQTMKMVDDAQKRWMGDDADNLIKREMERDLIGKIIDHTEIYEEKDIVAMRTIYKARIRILKGR